MKTNATNLKRGDFIFFRNEIWQIIKTIFSFQGRGMANIKFKIKSIKSGKNIDVTLKSNEQLDTVDVTLEKMQYLYSDKDTLFFMNKTYNQFSVSKKIVGDFYQFLKEGDDCYIYIYEDNALTLKKPEKVILKVTESQEAVKGDTTGSAKKKVKTQTGVEVLVPLFIKKEDYIVVDPETRDYIERVTNKNKNL